MNNEETDTIQQQEQTNNENYTGIITFNQRIYEIIIAKGLSLKDPRNFMKKIDDFLIRKLIRYFKLYRTEQAVYVQNLQGNIR